MGRARGLFGEFKQFALKGNVIDLAVAVVVGNAFSAVVNSLVSGIISPFISLLGGTNVRNYSVVLRGAETTANGSTTPAVVLAYGNFLQSIESFIIVAGSIFVVIKIISIARERLFRKEESGEAPPPPKSDEVKLLEEIRDLLKVSPDTPHP